MLRTLWTWEVRNRRRGPLGSSPTVGSTSISSLTWASMSWSSSLMLVLEEGLDPFFLVSIVSFVFLFRRINVFVLSYDEHLGGDSRRFQRGLKRKPMALIKKLRKAVRCLRLSCQSPYLASFHPSYAVTSSVCFCLISYVKPCLVFLMFWYMQK